MPGQPTARLEPEHAGVEVELVVHDDDLPGLVDLVTAHQRRDRLTRLVHVRDRKGEHDTLDVGAGSEPGLTDQGVVAAGLERRVVALGQQANALLADVVAGAGVLLAGVAETDDEPIERGAAGWHADRTGPSLSCGWRSLAGSCLGCRPRRQPSPSPASPSAASPSSPSSAAAARLELLALVTRTVTTAVSGSAVAVTPAGSSISPSVITVSIVMSVMSMTISFGDVPRRGADLDRVDRRIDETALVDHCLGLALEAHRDGDRDLLVEVDLQEVDVRHIAAHRMALELLDDRRVDLAVDGEVEDGVDTGRAGQGVAELAADDRDRDRLHALAVDDGRDVIFTPHAAGVGAARGAAGFGDKNGGHCDQPRGIGRASSAPAYRPGVSHSATTTVAEAERPKTSGA